AKAFRLPSWVWGLPARGPAYGTGLPDWLARYDRDSSSWKTRQRCFLEGWATFSETWPRSGIVVNGIAYRLAPLVPLTAATGFGLLPTPTAEAYGTNQGGSMGRVGPGRPSLQTMARQNLWPTRPPMWPTPTAGDAKASGSRNTPTSNAHAGSSLTDAVRADGGTGRRMTWPTPTSRDYKDGSAASCRNVPVNGLLGRAVHR